MSAHRPSGHHTDQVGVGRELLDSQEGPAGHIQAVLVASVDAQIGIQAACCRHTRAVASLVVEADTGPKDWARCREVEQVLGPP